MGTTSLRQCRRPAFPLRISTAAQRRRFDARAHHHCNSTSRAAVPRLQPAEDMLSPASLASAVLHKAPRTHTAGTRTRFQRKSLGLSESKHQPWRVLECSGLAHTAHRERQTRDKVWYTDQSWLTYHA